MLYPVHWADRDIQPLVASRTVVVCYHHPVSEVNYLSSLFFVYLLVGFRIHAIHPDYQLLPVLVGNRSDVFQEILHAKGVFVIRGHERRREKNALKVRIGVNFFDEAHDAGPLFLFCAG